MNNIICKNYPMPGHRLSPGRGMAVDRSGRKSTMQFSAAATFDIAMFAMVIGFIIGMVLAAPAKPSSDNRTSISAEVEE